MDLLICERNQILTTNLFTKPTDRNTLLHFKSYHLRSLRENLPYWQFLQFLGYCTTREDYLSNAEMLSDKLRQREYPKILVKISMKRALFTPRETLLTPKKTSIGIPIGLAFVL